VVGVGSVQHFAFAVDSAEEQVAWRDYLRERGAEATDVFERGGFRSIYLRDPDNHIVEIATRPDSPAGPALGASGGGSGASHAEPPRAEGSGLGGAEAAGLPTEPGASDSSS